MVCLLCDFKILLTVFNQSYNCQTSHYLGRNRRPKPFLILPSLVFLNSILFCNSSFFLWSFAPISLKLTSCNIKGLNWSGVNLNRSVGIRAKPHFWDILFSYLEVQDCIKKNVTNRKNCWQSAPKKPGYFFLLSKSL